MLLALMLVLGYNNKQKVPGLVFITVVIMNFIMLYLGYLGEREKLDKNIALVSSFIFFFGVFGLIWFTFIRNHRNMTNYVIFGLYIFIWSIYGLVYMADEETKNITFNILDLSAKCLIGLGFWVYFTKIISF
jgi:ABC-type Mn2+/Zn2+ transport system permease subunit